MGDDVSTRNISSIDAGGANGNSHVALMDRPAYPLASALADLAYADRRTALLIQSALVLAGCGDAIIRRVHQYIADAGAISLLTALRNRCGFTFSHSLKTMELSVRVAARLGHDDGEQAILCMGALLHDIGKLSVPASLLMLQRSLREVEIEKIRTHAEAGYDLLSDTRIFGWNSVLEIVRHHHEYLDGSGYPFGLSAPQISWRTRCVTVCDVLSALTERRPYRPAMSRDEAFSILAEMTQAGKLDGEIVDIVRSNSILEFITNK